MNGGVASGGPTGAVANETGMIHVANVKARWGILTPRLRMAPQAEVRVTDGQELGVDGAVRIVASSASFAQRGVLKDKRPGLLSMALGARLVQARHGDTSGSFHNIQAMRIMA